MKNRSLLMIPGPIEFDPEVLSALGTPTTSHVAPDFIDIFGKALEQLRQVVFSKDGQPFILAGSGTLAMDSVGSNLVENGDRALVVNTGYFGDRFGSLLERYGATVTHVRAPIGGHPDLGEVEQLLNKNLYKLMTVTHVDTSTGVLADVQAVSRLASQHGVLMVVDGVCSVAGEELRMSEWGIDIILTASQKAVGVPPGLALFVASQKAIQAFNARKSPVLNYYADWANWLPIMQAYEARKPGYFATPAVNLVNALNVSLSQILREGMPARIFRHTAISRACKAGIEALGLAQVPGGTAISAHTMTAPRYPGGISPQDFLAGMSRSGVVVAGGLHPAIRNEYFRIGHMGAVNIGDVLATLSAVESALDGCGYSFQKGVSLAAAQAVFL